MIEYRKTPPGRATLQTLLTTMGLAPRQLLRCKAHRMTNSDWTILCRATTRCSMLC